MESELSLSKLQADLHHALKSWHKASVEASSLDYLRLFRQAHREGAGNARQATNEILLDALKTLEVEYEQEAALLRKRYLDGMTVRAVENWLNVGEATVQRWQKRAIERLAHILYFQELQLRDARQAVLKERLETPCYTQLVGIEAYLNQLTEVLGSREPPWLISIEGIGGIGKTSLADAISRQIIDTGVFDDFAWVSARRVIFNPGGAIVSLDVPAMTAEDLVEKLVSQLMVDTSRLTAFSPQNALAALQTRLKQNRHLIVIDNLESLVDLESIMPTLRELANPTKFLLTSRQSWHHEPGLYHFSLPELDATHALRLIRHEAHLHNLPYLENATDDDLRQIYETVGGNPLALRLVVGQTHIHALNVILNDLTAAQGQKAEQLYTFIYRRAWDSFDELTRRVFLAMPLVSDRGGDQAYLANLTALDLANVGDALERLVALNLVDSKGDLHNRRYTIHNLTRTFLQEQVARWD